MDELKLDEFDRLVIIAVAVVIFLISVLIASCCVIPCCCGYKWLHKERKKDEGDDISMIESPKKKIFINVNKTPIYQSAGTHVRILDTAHENGHLAQSDFNSAYAPMYFLPFSSVAPKKPPRAKLNIQFCSGTDENGMGRLSIHIIQIENLPQRDYPTLPDSTVVLEVLNKQWNPLRENRMMHRVQSRLIRSEESPMFDQTFTFAVPKSDLKSWILQLIATDEDRLTRCRETCSGRVNFKDVQCLREGTPCSVSIPMVPTRSDFGQILVALSYLPTAQRLSVTVIKGTKLQWEHVTPSLQFFHPHIRVLLLDHAGRILKKKKISGTSRSDSPTFSGSMTLQVAHTGFETATLLLVVCSGMEKERQSGGDGSESPKKKDVLGFAALGWMVNDETGQEHWRAVFSKPRTSISQWHSLR